MKFGSLFAGIGGIDLGLERAGMECAWQVEIDDYCTRVLEKHWPDVPRYGDVRGLAPPAVDLIAGGFPCQPHSVAGKRRGAEDDRNLWPEFIRVIRELEPRYVLAENVPGIVTTYIDTVLSDLEGEGYTCATFNLPAVAFDAPHRRERIFIVAYNANGSRESQVKGMATRNTADSKRIRGDVSDALRAVRKPGSGRGRIRQSDSDVADTSISGLSKPARGEVGSIRETQGQCQGRELGRGDTTPRTHWTTEPDMGRVAHGIPSRVDRLRGLGNAVVPQVAEWIGRRIMEFDDQ